MRRARTHQFDRGAGPLRRTRSGTQEHAVEFAGNRGDLSGAGQPRIVVTPHLRINTELAQILDQVEHEAVVVVDDQDLHV